MQTNHISRRQYERHAVPEGSFILYNNSVGQILNMSEVGLAVRLSSNTGLLANELDSTFICRSNTEEIDKLTLKLVHSEDHKTPSFSGYATQTVGIAFHNLDSNQQAQIRHHVSKLPLA